MRTFEYAALTICVSALAILGASALSGAISKSFNQSAALIAQKG